MIEAVGYVRVSSKKQEDEGYSIPSQIKLLKNYAENNNKPDEILKNKNHYEKMFCAFEKSNCIHANKGCLCRSCPNFKQYGLQNCTYCTHTCGGACEC